MNDFCDGELSCEHPLFSVDEQALQVLLYNDDVEICNPLGSRAKIHKMCKCLIDLLVYCTVWVMYLYSYAKIATIIAILTLLFGIIKHCTIQVVKDLITAIPLPYLAMLYLDFLHACIFSKLYLVLHVYMLLSSSGA